jgi:hypothetical protein
MVVPTATRTNRAIFQYRTTVVNNNNNNNKKETTQPVAKQKGDGKSTLTKSGPNFKFFSGIIRVMVLLCAELNQFRTAWDLLCRRARGPTGSTMILVSPDADGICAARIVEV